MTDAARWKATVHIGGLSPYVTTSTLHDAFIPFGEVADISLPSNENPNTRNEEPHRGFAYVEFEDVEDAKEAIDNMDQAELFGRVIRVSAAKAPKSADEGLGSKKALWEQESWIAANAADEGNGLAPDSGVIEEGPSDPMEGIVEPDVVGPRAA